MTDLSTIIASNQDPHDTKELPPLAPEPAWLSRLREKHEAARRAEEQRRNIENKERETREMKALESFLKRNGLDELCPVKNPEIERDGIWFSAREDDEDSACHIYIGREIRGARTWKFACIHHETIDIPSIFDGIGTHSTFKYTPPPTIVTPHDRHAINLMERVSKKVRDGHDLSPREDMLLSMARWSWWLEAALDPADAHGTDDIPF